VGEMVAPKVISIMLDSETSKGVVSSKNQHMLVKTVIEAFLTHREALKEASCNPDAIGAKLLVSCVGSDELALVQDSAEFREWCKLNGVKVFSFSSRFGSYQDFEESSNRCRVYDDMRALKDEEDCILLHIDILAEGIDLPAITGVLLLRHLNEIKLFQTLGRALRLTKTDRANLYNGTISPLDRSKWLKPYAYLILPLHFEQMDVSGEDMKTTILRVLDTYGIPVEEFLPTEKFKAHDIKSLDPVTDYRKISKVKKDFPLKCVIDELIKNKFLEGFPTDKTEREKVLQDLFKSLNENGGIVDA